MKDIAKYELEPVIGNSYVKYDTKEVYQVLNFAMNENYRKVVICLRTSDNTLWAFSRDNFFNERYFEGHNVSYFIDANHYISNTPYINHNRHTTKCPVCDDRIQSNATDTITSNYYNYEPELESNKGTNSKYNFKF
jgi:uncharacterized protein YlaI